MKWSDAYSTGIERIDQQHQLLFKTADDFRAALQDQAGEASYAMLLSFLDGYTRAHFGFEEGCMEQYHCPVAQKNKDAHAQFTEVLAGFRQRYAANGFDRAEAHELVDTIDRWLADHICHVDAHLKRCVEKS